MAQRPALLDLRSDSQFSNVSKPLRSPRVHVAGEAPPELSPLDAFAMQSRLLARQLQDSDRDGNRLSRLPPLTVESPLIVQGRSEYFRLMSMDSGSEGGDSPGRTAPGLGFRTEVEDAFDEAERPKSMHPRMSRIPPTPDEDIPVPMVPAQPVEIVPAIPPRDPSRGRKLSKTPEPETIFGGRTERSPSPMQSDTQSQSDRFMDTSPVRKDDGLFFPSPKANGSPDKYRQDSFDELGLAPPRALFPRRASSIMSSPLLPTEEEGSGNMSGSFHSLPPRKMSSGSTVFAGAVPSAAIGSFGRSPSVGSDCSAALPRPSFNFSRPLSRSGTPAMDLPSRQASSDSQPSFILADDAAHTPVSMHSEAFGEHNSEERAAPSYIYSKFTLPRGKTLQRGESIDQTQTAFRWEQPLPPHNGVQRINTDIPPSPPTQPSSPSAKTAPDGGLTPSSPLPPNELRKVNSENSPFTLQPSHAEVERFSEDIPRGRGRTPVANITHTAQPPNTVNDAASTRPPPTARSVAPTASEMSAEEHLAKGIECHENGSLKESTYHLRHAAILNNPTAMLLYALACRHGWGMRANQKEGVEWLRKAAEYASVEIADDEDQVKGGKHVDVIERRTRKAQFALSIYELGVSHMNGWGIEQDKSLALRCFEIAGSWGDVDALAEAGFCYAQGVGCKKNLKQSAKFYRMAEAKGMSMVGNSWIHKPKYNEDDEDSSRRDKKKSRSKSRTRTMFGRK